VEKNYFHQIILKLQTSQIIQYDVIYLKISPILSHELQSTWLTFNM